MGHPFGRGMCAVGSTEGVVDINFGGAGKLFGELFVIRFFLGMETGVLKNEHFARAKLST